MSLTITLIVLNLSGALWGFGIGYTIGVKHGRNEAEFDLRGIRKGLKK